LHRLKILFQIEAEINHNFIIREKVVSSILRIRANLYRGGSLKDKSRF